MNKEQNKEQFQKLPSKMIRVIICIFILTFFSCKTNNDNQYNIKSFFTITKWDDFNDKTLKENNLSHFIKDKIDFFNRETFFESMKDSKYDTFYKDFYLVEIVNPNGERSYSRKILVINYDDKISYLGFIESLNWQKLDVTKEEINNFQYNTLTSGIRKNDGDLILITHIEGNKY